MAVTNLELPADLLEIGCATGKATLPLAKRGFRISAIEPGVNLADQARRNLADLEVNVINASFEEWQPDPRHLFDLVYAATAWKWVDPAVRYRSAWEALRPNGHLAFWNAIHVFPENSDPFFYEIQDVYNEIGEGLPKDAVFPRPGELKDDSSEIHESGLFETVHIRHFDWEITYDAESYIAYSKPSPIISRWRR